MDLTPPITLPEIIPADKAIEQIRRYTPDNFVNCINSHIQELIRTIRDINHVKKKINITEYASGYTLHEMRALVKKLIKEYNTKGYIIKYKVYYHTSSYCMPEYRLKIKSIRFKTSNTKSTQPIHNDPPPYSESVKVNKGGIKRFTCGLL